MTGSRDWVNRRLIWITLNQELIQFPEGIVVVHGGARGADDIADRWAWGMQSQGHKTAVEVHRPDYVTHGDRAPLVRNHEMAASGADVCHAFPLQGSMGTRHCMTRCYAAGIPVVNHGFQHYTYQAQAFAEAYG